jgi:hypothetical protein
MYSNRYSEVVETTSYPDRHKWFESISWSQFHVNEFTTTPPAELTQQFQIEK